MGINNNLVDANIERKDLDLFDTYAYANLLLVTVQMRFQF